jgi:hypothetical protein
LSLLANIVHVIKILVPTAIHSK